MIKALITSGLSTGTVKYLVTLGLDSGALRVAVPRGRFIGGQGALPSETGAALLFLNDRQQELHVRLNYLEGMLANELHAEPSKPRNGLLVFADGTDWDPGSGKGLYVYIDGAWHPAAT